MPERRLRLLRTWRRVVSTLARTVKEMYPEASVYLLGGAAEDRLTALSDVDVAVVFDRELGAGERARILAALWRELERRGVPAYYPLHIIVLNKRELDRMKGRVEKLA